MRQFPFGRYVAAASVAVIAAASSCYPFAGPSLIAVHRSSVVLQSTAGLFLTAYPHRYVDPSPSADLGSIVYLHRSSHVSNKSRSLGRCDYPMTPLPRSTQTSMAVNTESAKNPSGGERSSQRSCLSNNS